MPTLINSKPRKTAPVLADPILGLDSENNQVLREMHIADILALKNTFGTIAVAGQSSVVADASNDTLTLAAGSNITITTDAGTDTVTIAATGGAGGNSFSNIAVAGQTAVAADSSTDTLTLIAGTNITLTTDAVADSVTITGPTLPNVFGTIAVAGQSNIVADSTTDTLTVAVAGGLSAATDAATDTLTLSFNAATAAPGLFTQQQNFQRATLVDGANIAWNLNTAQAARVTLAGNRTLANPTNMVDGGTYILEVRQDATGGRTLAFGSAYDWGADGAPTLSTGANVRDVLTFVSDGTKMQGSIKKGYTA